MDNPRRQRPFVRRSDADAPDAHPLDALGNELRALPELAAPSGLWERVREHLDEDGAVQSPPPRRWRRQTPLAVAASVALIAVAAVLAWVHVSTRDIEPAADRGVADDDGLTQRVAERLDRHDTIAVLLEQSRRAEERRRAVLAFYSPSGPEQVLRAHIGGIDAALNEQVFRGQIEPKSREALLRDRVDLMGDLTDIERYRQHEFVRQVSF